MLSITLVAFSMLGSELSQGKAERVHEAWKFEGWHNIRTHLALVNLPLSKANRRYADLSKALSSRLGVWTTLWGKVWECVPALFFLFACQVRKRQGVPQKLYRGNAQKLCPQYTDTHPLSSKPFTRSSTNDPSPRVDLNDVSIRSLKGDRFHW